MPVPDAFVGKPFKISEHLEEIRVRKDGGGKTRALAGPVVTFEADDDVNIAALMRSRAIAPVEDEPKRHRRSETADEPAENSEREGG